MGSLLFALTLAGLPVLLRSENPARPQLPPKVEDPRHRDGDGSDRSSDAWG
jgi:hypothetical protein